MDYYAKLVHCSKWGVSRAPHAESGSAVQPVMGSLLIWLLPSVPNAKANMGKGSGKCQGSSPPLTCQAPSRSNNHSRHLREDGLVCYSINSNNKGSNVEFRATVKAHTDPKATTLSPPQSEEIFVPFKGRM